MECRRIGSDGHEEGIKGVDLGCGLRRVGAAGRYEVVKLHCSGPLLVIKI